MDTPPDVQDAEVVVVASWGKVNFVVIFEVYLGYV